MPTIYCIGKNYAAHVREMGGAAGEVGEPVVFLKPWAALLSAPTPIVLPPGAGEIHYEAEIVVRLGEREAGKPIGVEAVGLGLDLTDRTLQAAAKAKGHPWAAAKGFRGSAPLGPLVPVARVPGLGGLRFQLAVNGEVRQRGDTALLLRPIPHLLLSLDAWFGLVPGDLVFTGTPEGVGPVRSGDHLVLEMGDVAEATAQFHVA